MGIPIVSGLNDHQLAGLIILAGIFQVGILIKLHFTAKDAKAANNQTTGTGNGFAKHVLDKLDTLTSSSEILQRSVERVQATQDEYRDRLQYTAQYVQRVDKRQQDHLEYHINKENPHA